MNITADFLNKLGEFEKKYITVADLEKLWERKRVSLKVMVQRLIKAGFLMRLKPGVYVLPDNLAFLAEIANQLYYPSYLSFSSALSRYGVIGQVPYSLTFATTKKSKTMDLGGKEVVYSQIKPELYFGYQLVERMNIADPEKALLDQLYLAALGKAKVDFEELTLTDLDKKRWGEYVKRFPDRVKPAVREINRRWGQVFVGIDK